jgi:hypothetical protein
VAFLAEAGFVSQADGAKVAEVRGPARKIVAYANRLAYLQGQQRPDLRCGTLIDKILALLLNGCETAELAAPSDRRWNP